MAVVVGVRFKKAGKIYSFLPSGLDIVPGDPVVVEGSHGPEFGHVMIPPRPVSDEAITPPLRKVIRVATPEDIARVEEIREEQRQAFKVALERIEARGMDMNLVDVEINFARSKMLFLFTAEERVDFRALVRDLAAIFHSRIEMRQVGARDEAKLLGGIGPCGRILCCTSFLTEFKPVSIRMAKAQNLALNPTKISGVCGRLMCCLKYEFRGEETEEPEEDSFAWRVREAQRLGAAHGGSTSSGAGTAPSTPESVRTSTRGSRHTSGARGRGTREDADR